MLLSPLFHVAAQSFFRKGFTFAKKAPFFLDKQAFFALLTADFDGAFFSIR